MKIDNEYEKLDSYVKADLLKKKTDNEGREIFCYTKDCFISGEWDEITKNHRGKIYKDGKPLNQPFKKIFNLNEVEETRIDNVLDAMNNREYDVYDKANGHLLIVSVYKEGDETKVMFNTKFGYLQGDEESELIQKDVEIFKEKFYDNFMNVVTEKIPTLGICSTWMFEAIVEHDKHTLYEKQVESYDQETFVLLGINNFDRETGEYFEVEYEYLNLISAILGFPIVGKYDNETMGKEIDTWKNDKDIEGYVIHFPETEDKESFRVKIKTDEYWQLRFKKDLSPERIVGLFIGGGFDRMKNKLPEEVRDKLIDVIKNDYSSWYHNRIVPYQKFQKWVKEEPRSIAMTDELTKQQKTYILSFMKQGIKFVNYMPSFRDMYKEFCIENNYERIVQKLNNITGV